MSASAVIQSVYRSHIEHFGQPTRSLRFDDGRPQDGFPDLVDIFIWSADEGCDITTLSTIGMADVLQPGAGYRTELHFSVRRLMSDSEQKACARWLANLAMYPFTNRVALDWWHTLSNPGAIPQFPTMECVLMHPRFVPEGWDSIATEAGDVRILNVVPISREVKELRSRSAISQRLEGTDIFLPR